MFGLRRIGKTLLCQEQMRRLAEQGRVIPAYINLEGICTSPELFVQRYIGLTCFWAAAGGEGAIEKPLYDAKSICCKRLQQRSPLSSRQCVSCSPEFSVQRLIPGRCCIRPLTSRIVWRQPVGRPIMCFLDKFTELTALARFPQVGDPYKLFRAVMQQHAHVGYVVTGSVTHGSGAVGAQP